MTDRTPPNGLSTLAEIIERGVIWPLIEREMEILIRHGLIQSPPPNPFDEPNAKES